MYGVAAAIFPILNLFPFRSCCQPFHSFVNIPVFYKLKTCFAQQDMQALIIGRQGKILAARQPTTNLALFQPAKEFPVMVGSLSQSGFPPDVTGAPAEPPAASATLARGFRRMQTGQCGSTLGRSQPFRVVQVTGVYGRNVGEMAIGLFQGPRRRSVRPR